MPHSGRMLEDSIHRETPSDPTSRSKVHGSEGVLRQALRPHGGAARIKRWVAVALGCYAAAAVLNACAWLLTDVPEGDTSRDEDGG